MTSTPNRLGRRAIERENPMRDDTHASDATRVWTHTGRRIVTRGPRTRQAAGDRDHSHEPLPDFVQRHETHEYVHARAFRQGVYAAV